MWQNTVHLTQRIKTKTEQLEPRSNYSGRVLGVQDLSYSSLPLKHWTNKRFDRQWPQNYRILTFDRHVQKVTGFNMLWCLTFKQCCKAISFKFRKTVFLLKHSNIGSMDYFINFILSYAILKVKCISTLSDNLTLINVIKKKITKIYTLKVKNHVEAINIIQCK